ncbi:unnamed protein product [Mytilus coruscus]|uniref:Uncharacterized protein n=1 Tax=Mytilus coruscus TaxID=42192 RepID=A0A6J7ZXS8_MYTCO|nr:unnamed protein product [Mytilus coruscus]
MSKRQSSAFDDSQEEGDFSQRDLFAEALPSAQDSADNAVGIPQNVGNEIYIKNGKDVQAIPLQDFCKTYLESYASSASIDVGDSPDRIQFCLVLRSFLHSKKLNVEGSDELEFFDDFWAKIGEYYEEVVKTDDERKWDRLRIIDNRRMTQRQAAQQPDTYLQQGYKYPQQPGQSHKSQQFNTQGKCSTDIPSTYQYQLSISNTQGGVNRVQQQLVQTQTDVPSHQQVTNHQMGSTNQQQGVKKIQNLCYKFRKPTTKARPASTRESSNFNHQRATDSLQQTFIRPKVYPYNSDYYERQRRSDPGQNYTCDFDTSDVSAHRRTRNKRRLEPAYYRPRNEFAQARSVRNFPAQSRHRHKRNFTSRESQSESETDRQHSKHRKKKIEKMQFLSSFSGYGRIAVWTDEQKREKQCWC